MMNILRNALVGLIALILYAAPAQATLINVDPGGYTGTYRVDGGSNVSGSTIVDLAAGNH